MKSNSWIPVVCLLQRRTTTWKGGERYICHSLRRNSSYPDQRQDYSTQYHHTGRKKLQSLFRIPTYWRDRAICNDRASRFLRIPSAGTLSGSRQSPRNTALGQKQSVLLGLRHSDGTKGIYHETLSELWPWSVSGYLDSHPCFSAQRRLHTSRSCPQLKGRFNSLVAGFLETGETLEECVAREVKEETGLDVKNITYFATSPGPTPAD